MPFIVIASKGEEVGRWPLCDGAPVVIGRSPECDVAVRDILLSRRHCRLEPSGPPERTEWTVIDLESKNGTQVGDEAVTRRALRDGDVLTLGKTRVTFFAGSPDSLPAAPAPEPNANRAPGARLRPASPLDAMADTVSGVDVMAALAGRLEHHPPRTNEFPAPRP